MDVHDTKKAEEITNKLQQGKTALSSDETRFIERADEKLDTYELKKISDESQRHGDLLNSANLKSFETVELMYFIGFLSGVALLLSAIGVFIYNVVNGSSGTEAISANIVSGILGGIGIADIVILLYTPVRELQRSRGNLSKLSTLYNEWQYISSWTGKTYNVLHKKLKNDKGLEPKQKELLNEMRWLIELKSDTSSKLAELMAEMTTHTESKSIKVSISSKPDAPEVNSKIELEADVHGISTSEVDKIIYSWREESGTITIDNKDKRKASFTSNKAGDFTIKIEVKSGDKTGVAESKITIKPKVSITADPKDVKKGSKVKLSANVEGLEDEEKKKLTYKWEEQNQSITISPDDQAEIEVTPQSEDTLKFKVTIKKESEDFATKEVEVEVTA